MPKVKATPTKQIQPPPSVGDLFKVTDKENGDVKYCILTSPYDEPENSRLVYLDCGTIWNRFGSAKFVTTSCSLFTIEKFDGKIELS